MYQRATLLATPCAGVSSTSMIQRLQDSGRRLLERVRASRSGGGGWVGSVGRLLHSEFVSSNKKTKRASKTHEVQCLTFNAPKWHGSVADPCKKLTSESRTGLLSNRMAGLLESPTHGCKAPLHVAQDLVHPSKLPIGKCHMHVMETPAYQISDLLIFSLQSPTLPTRIHTPNRLPNFRLAQSITRATSSHQSVHRSPSSRARESYLPRGLRRSRTVRNRSSSSSSSSSRYSRWSSSQQPRIRSR